MWKWFVAEFFPSTREAEKREIEEISPSISLIEARGLKIF